MNPSQPPKGVRLWLGVVAVALAWAVLNRASALFEIRPGLTFFFPAAAVTVVAGAWLRYWGAVAVFAGNLLLPWGAAATGLVPAILFSLPGALWAALVALLVGLGRVPWSRLWSFLHIGVLAGSAAAAALGSALLATLVGPWSLSTFLANAARWWVSDFVAAAVFGMALVVVVRPQCVLSEEEVRQWRLWWGRPSDWLLVGALAVGGEAVILLVSRVTVARVHWLAVLLLPALTVAGMRGGLGAGLATNGLVSALYVASVFFFAFHRDTAAADLSAMYGNLLVFFGFAVFGGLMGGRNLQLLEIVRRQGEELATGLERTVEALAVAIEARDAGTDQRLWRIVRLAELVGREVGLAAHELEVLRRAAVLHNVGRVGVPERILMSPVSLRPEEVELIRARQVELGAEILGRVEFLSPVAAIVRYQKERWDGQRTGPFAGYFGLKGEEIPIGARILSVVLAYDSMTHDRPFRRAMTREAAVAELWRCSGAQFDPAVVAAFTRVLREDWDRTLEEMAGSGA
jgi:HD-GYP domain-containing protein (c-di-GMP phosphodiesterase class II)